MQSIFDIDVDKTNPNPNPNPNPTFIFIDGSYFCFHRFYALLSWWHLSHPEEATTNLETNLEFRQKFAESFVNKIKEIPKKVGIHKDVKPFLFVGKDCKRENIWRNEFVKGYKGTRENDPEFSGGHYIKMAYDDQLFIRGGAKHILSHPRLEADDCIAISVKYVLKKYDSCSIYIITSDKDYLQLAEPRVKIFSMNYKNLADQKSSTGSPECDLFCKIVMGDTSDNISSVLSKCGPKTALKCFHDRAYFEERLKKENAQQKYELNRTLVDFDYIPSDLMNEFMLTICK